MASINAATHQSITSCVICYTGCGAQNLVNKSDVTRLHEARYYDMMMNTVCPSEGKAFPLRSHEDIVGRWNVGFPFLL